MAILQFFSFLSAVKHSRPSSQCEAFWCGHFLGWWWQAILFSSLVSWNSFIPYHTLDPALLSLSLRQWFCFSALPHLYTLLSDNQQLVGGRLYEGCFRWSQWGLSRTFWNLQLWHQLIHMVSALWEREKKRSWLCSHLECSNNTSNCKHTSVSRHEFLSPENKQNTELHLMLVFSLLPPGSHVRPAACIGSDGGVAVFSYLHP